jgi:light-harvesting protein B-800-850 alpha chain
MIYGKIWTVVKPSVGIPVFLVAVALSSFLVHYMLLSHTTWVPKFLEGKGTKTAAIEVPASLATAPTTTLVAQATK